MKHTNKLFLLAIFFLTIHFQILAQIASGTVYLDVNGNGKRDRNEKGIKNVPVSNGRDVVLTDLNGKYSIPIKEHDVIFVIKPSEYNLPVNMLNLPQFYYIHKPNGSPELKYKGSKPTGALPKAIDFPLLPGNYAENFTILAFGDPQPSDIIQIDYFNRKVVSELENSTQFAFGITLGDNVDDDLGLFDNMNRVTSKVGIPWFNVVGNHDINFDVTVPNFAYETFTATYGPTTYAMNYGKVHFINLNNVIYPNPRSYGNYIGGISEEQFQFLENSLKLVPKDHLVVLFMHIHMFDVPDWGETFRHADRQRLFELLQDYPQTLSLSAHMHTQRHHFFYESEGWLQDNPHHHFNVGTTSGNWWLGELDENGLPDATMQDGTPNGYATIYFNGNEYEIDYFVSGAPKDYKMNIYAPKVVPHGKNFRGELFVNFFNGSDKCKLQFRVNDGEWIDMRKVIEPDPSYFAITHKWDMSEELLSGVRPLNPVNSMHLWKARVPSNLPEGEHIIEVKATDMFGREFRANKTYKLIMTE